MPLTGTDAIQSGSPVSGVGGVTRAKRGATLPADADTPLDTGVFTKLGYISEDGVTRKTDRDTEKIKAWGNYTVKTLIKDNSVTYSLTFLESSNGDLLKALFGEDNVVITTPKSGVHDGKIAIKHSAQLPEPAVFTLEMKDGDTAMREVIPNGQLTVTGDVTFVHNDVIRYEVEIDALNDEEIDGNAMSYQTEKASTAPAG